jgi:hypothetical protein
MIVVTFEDFTPLPRYDGQPWATVQIQEAPDRTGPWTTIDTQAISPLDTDPKNPATRSFTTENATLDEGWYRLIFIDQSSDEQQPTAPIKNAPEEEEAFLPSVQDVADLLRARTKDKFGNELGLFNDNTRPTDSGVRGLIRQAADDVIMMVDTDIPVEAYDLASTVISIGAAMLVELSYYPEQIGTPNSAYDRYREWYELMLQRLMLAVERETLEEELGEDAATGVFYQFPPMMTDWDKVIW